MTEARVDVKFEERPGIGRVAVVTVDNRTKLNCLDTTQVVALRGAFDLLANDANVRAAILTGAGDRA